MADPLPSTLSDGGFITGSYDIIVGGYAYTCDTHDHDLPVMQADATKADGTPKGGAFVKGKETISVKIHALTGIPAPAQLVPFEQAFNGFISKFWVVTNLKIASANTGAALRTYSADLCQHVNRPVATTP